MRKQHSLGWYKTRLEQQLNAAPITPIAFGPYTTFRFVLPNNRVYVCREDFANALDTHLSLARNRNTSTDQTFKLYIKECSYTYSAETLRNSLLNNLARMCKGLHELEDKLGYKRHKFIVEGQNNSLSYPNMDSCALTLQVSKRWFTATPMLSCYLGKARSLYQGKSNLAGTKYLTDLLLKHNPARLFGKRKVGSLRFVGSKGVYWFKNSYATKARLAEWEAAALKQKLKKKKQCGQS